MKITFSVLYTIILSSIAFGQPLSITNCGTIATDGLISSGSIPAANYYEYEVTNITNGQVLVVASNVASISLVEFTTIISYPANYKVRVRFNHGPPHKQKFSVWGNYCFFSLNTVPTNIHINEPLCNSVINSLETLITATPIPGATCYTFYVTNMTTGEFTSTGCQASNSFVLSSLPIAFGYNDQIIVSVSYSIGKIESPRSKNCKFNLELARPFCSVIQENRSIQEFNQNSNDSTKTIDYYFVGNLFYLTYSDNPSDAIFAPAVWETQFADIINVTTAVLLDLEEFILTNSVDPDCGMNGQRWGIEIHPYPQQWVDDNSFTDALAVASQFYDPTLDINFLSQGCSYIPNIQLPLNHGTYGDFTTIPIGSIYINPTIDNFNYLHLAPEGTFAGEYDLYTVILHEITHVFGFNHLDPKFQDFLVHSDLSGVDPLYNPGQLDCGTNPNFSTYSTSGCDEVIFNGTYSQDQVEAPSSFLPGTSLSHFPDECNTVVIGDFVMNPGLNMNVAKRCYHQNEVNALQELGFNFNSTHNTCNYSIHNEDYVIGNHDGLSVQADPDEGYNCDDVPNIPISNPICSSWPLIIEPLTNDINANAITQALIKTGAPGATVNIIGGNALEFTATLPGIYTIGYIPSNNVSGKTGLPTYVQVWVPSCGDTDLQDVICLDGGCNQICFDNEIEEHMLLRGNNWTQPTGFTGTENEFTFGATYGELDNYSGLTSSYGAVFFWVDVDPSAEYSLSFDRQYYELSPWGSSISDPAVTYSVFLVKSADMIGLVNHSSNNFTSLPSNKQLLAQEYFPELYNNLPVYESISFCFTAQDDYDMIIFYAEQVTNMTLGKVGIVQIKDLELMVKEFPNLPTEYNSCLPANINLGIPFCGTNNQIYTWTSFNTGDVLATTQTISLPPVVSTLIDQYTFSMNYPPLSTLTNYPLENATCSESVSISVAVENCCVDNSVPIHHPLTSNATNRTFGEDVDADINGALYYCGEIVENIQFGTLGTSIISSNPEGFIVKFHDNCTEWIVNTPYRQSSIEVTDQGRIYYSGSTSTSSIGHVSFSEINASNGSVIWSWNVTSGTPFLTDFVINETTNEILLVGYCNSSFMYGPQLISTTSNEIFIIKTDLNGTYIHHNTINTSSVATDAKISVDGIDIYVALKDDVGSWIIEKIDNTSLFPLMSPTPRTLNSSSNFSISRIEQSGNDILIQTVSDNNIVDQNTGTTLLSSSANSLSCIYLDNFLDPQVLFVDALQMDYFFPQFSYLRMPDMDVANNVSYFSYINDQNELIIRSLDFPSGILNWTQSSIPIDLNLDWIGTSGIKYTSSGVYNTGAFYSSMNIDGQIIYADDPYTSFYGIKYTPTGNVAALIINNEEEVIQNKSVITNEDLKNSSDVSFRIYPNPTCNSITVSGPDDFTLTIKDLNGKTLYYSSIFVEENVSMESLASGVYMIYISSETTNEVFKVLKL